MSLVSIAFKGISDLDFDKLIELIKASKYVITPECGILHITSLCQNYLTVIYDADYFPEMMMHEYAPWKKPYNKLIFNDEELNQKIEDKKSYYSLLIFLVSKHIKKN